MRIRKIEQWESELREKLEEVIKETTRDRDIRWKFMEDSKALDEGVDKIVNTMRRLDQHASRREEIQRMKEEFDQVDEKDGDDNCTE